MNWIFYGFYDFVTGRKVLVAVYFINKLNIKKIIFTVRKKQENPTSILKNHITLEISQTHFEAASFHGFV